jgi:glycosyltransferase involved in cell wall biosynthesis
VVPCYNEEEVLNATIKELTVVLEDLIRQNMVSKDSFLLFVDDGSRDNSWKIIEESSKINHFVKGIKLSRNVGHQNALVAGMDYCKNRCDLLITIDADLQDDIRVIEKMVKEYLKGSEIVYGVKKERDVDTIFKKKTAEFFYKFMRLMGVELIYNHADFRLMSRKALEFFFQFEEGNLFLRGIIPLIGLRSAKIYYDRKHRLAGESKYTLKKMLQLALNGITSFSIVPLRVITITGFVVFLFSFLMGIYATYIALFTTKGVPGWASTILSIYLLGGIQMVFLGIVGEYIGKIYMEVKRRPRYFIEGVIDE